MGERRLVLSLLAVAAMTVGIWAAALPASFFADFPLGRGWVVVDGAYNEHLVRDVGALHLALAVVTLAAWRWPTPTQVRSVAAAWLVFTVPHLAYHLAHADLLALPDTVVQAVLLAVQVLAPAWLLARPVPRPRPTTAARGPITSGGPITAGEETPSRSGVQRGGP